MDRKTASPVVRVATLLAFALALAPAISPVFAQGSKVEAVKDEGGWKLVADGRDFQVKGVVWSFTPVGENYTYDLWSRPEDFIRRTIDTDMTLLKRMGATAIRAFTTIPPEWIEYIHARYGIWTIVNDLFGRYGVTVDGRWYAHTDYSDPATRAFLLEQARKTFETYKDVDGVLMFMLGNESNYGLEWSSGAIEDLPQGQRLDAKARFLYSLFGEAVELGKSIDPDHPVGIVNGDLGYLDLVVELCPSLDILGVNTYRGRRAYSGFYASVEEALDVPIVFTEFGADAYDIVREVEDQYSQAEYLRDQWDELYSQSYGKGRSQNVVGGFVFEWMDEWWKHGMESGLDEHDTSGTWTNGAYDFDATAGRNNMNEEWFGIVALGELSDDGLHRRVPRAAYWLLKEAWTLDLYRSGSKQAKDHFASLSIADAVARADATALRNELAERSPLSVSGSVEARGFLAATETDLAALEGAKERLEFRCVETARVDLAFRPNDGLAAALSLDFGTGGRYFDADGALLSWFAAPGTLTWQKGTTAPVAVASISGLYEDDALRAEFFYKTGHADWALEGDAFGFLPEAFDRYSMDLNGSAAPFGLELAFKGAFEGLALYGGPEPYAGAMPSLLGKYRREFGNLTLALLHAEELAYPDAVLGGAVRAAEYAKTPLSRRTSAMVEYSRPGAFKAQLGLMLGSPERIGETFDVAAPTAPGTGSGGSAWNVYLDRRATALDSLGAKLRFSTDAVPYLTLAYVQGLYLGPLAGGESAIARGGSFIADPGTGNRIEAEAGLTFAYGPLALSPKFLWREPVYGPLPSLPLLTVTPRDYTDLFFVWNNRKAIRGELVAAWDPTGATWFHDWNNDDREDAAFAASLAFGYDFLLGATDSSSFISDSDGTVMVWPSGLPEISGTWSLEARVVARFAPAVRLVATASAGRAQSGGDPAQEPAEYAGGTARLMVDRLTIDGELFLDSWGPEAWYREFQITFPVQAKLGASWAFGKPSLMDAANRFGFELHYRSFGPGAPAEQTASGTIDWRAEARAWVNFSL